MRPESTRKSLLAGAVLIALGGCLTPTEYAARADEQVYDILENASAHVTGERKIFPIGPPAASLRERLLEHGGEVFLDLPAALDAAAENSRDFAREKESLYLTALSLTREQHEFALRWGGGGAADVSGVGDDEASLSLTDDLSAAVRTTAGTRIVASFVNTFFRSLVHGGGWDEASLLGLSLTQPLLRGFGKRIVREGLTQAERDVVYAIRSFERFRESFAVEVVSAYYGVLQELENLDSERENYESIKLSREQIDAMFEAGRRNIIDVGRARQDELSAENRLVNAQNRLQAQLDSLKLLLGLPPDAAIVLDRNAFTRLEAIGVELVPIEEQRAIELALMRRWDYRTALDEVDDAARRVLLAEDALGSALDFSAAVEVPTEPDKPLKFDWSQVRWSAGFNLDLALDRLAERNAYRSALISLDAAMRARDELADRIKEQIRNALRDIESRVANFQIQSLAVDLASERVRASQELYQAGRIEALDLLDAQEALLNAKISRTAALVDYAIARLRLLRDLEALVLEPKGLRLDLTLPLPQGPREAPDDRAHLPPR